MIPSADDVVGATQRVQSRRGNWALVRFAMSWLFVVSVVGLFVPNALGWAIAGLVISIMLWLFAHAGVRACDNVLASYTEYVMFHTPEGQQAIRDEAGRRLREGDY